MDKQYALEIGLGRYLRRVFLYKLQTVLLKREVEVTLPTGLPLKLPLGHAHSAEIYGTNCLVDWGAEDLLLGYLETCGERAGRDVYDVGANIGFYSLLLSPRVHAVHAFEPDPRNLAPLRANAARASNVHVVDQAVSETGGQRVFDVSGGHEINHLAQPGEAPSGPGSLTVETTTLDAYRAAHPGPRVAAVKMDVEGYECEALGGAHAFTDENRPVFLIEFFEGPPGINTFARLGDFLTRHGYEIYAVVRDRDFARTRRVELRRLTLEETPATRTKMLFLVPRSERYFAKRLGPLAVPRK